MQRDSPSIAKVIAWLDLGVALASHDSAKKPPTAARALWCLLQFTLNGRLNHGAAFDSERTAWVIGLTAYMNGRFRDVAGSKQALLGLARNMEKDNVAVLLGRNPKGENHHAIRLFRNRALQIIIEGIERDYGLVPAKDGIGFELRLT